MKAMKAIQRPREAGGDQPIHAGRCRGGEGGEAEDDEVELVGEAPPEPIAQEAGNHRADGHADEGPGDELRDLGQHGELRLHRGAQHGRADIKIVAVEEHAGADQPEDAIVKRGYRQPVEPRAGIHR